MDEELEDLESIISGHFGRTPVTTPCCSQDLEEDQDDANIEEESLVEEMPLVQYRVRQLVSSFDSGSEVSNDEDSSDYDSENQDYVNVKEFIKDCGCKKQCQNKFSLKEAYDILLSNKEKSKEEKELLIMGVLHAEKQDEMKTKRGKKRIRTRTQFHVNGIAVCRPTFQLLFDVKRTTLNNIIKHMNITGTEPRIHGNKGRRPKHALTFDDVQCVVQFILNIAEDRGIQYPAAPRGNDNLPTVFLSSDTTKLTLHREYLDVCRQRSVRHVKLSAFKNIWSSCVPHIKIAKPRDDVCSTCERIRQQIAGAVTEADKLTAAENMRVHIINAQQERKVYNECVAKAQREPDTFHHYTFDFSQCVSLPHYSRQMSTMYFLSLRKVQIFGFRISAGKQLNYLIDEGDSIGKDGKYTHGPNAVISMIDHALESHCLPGDTFTIHADNCPGQNKNMYVLGYFLWRVMTGQQRKIEYLMQIPGHARCHVDSGFATLKKCYRRHNSETLGELAEAVDRSSITNMPVRYPQWVWRDWKSFLSIYFKSLKGIRKYQYFRFTNDMPGIVVVKERNDGIEVEANLLKDRSHRFQADTRPAVIPAAGLSTDRKEYFRSKICPNISSGKQEQFCDVFTN